MEKQSNGHSSKEMKFNAVVAGEYHTSKLTGYVGPAIRHGRLVTYFMAVDVDLARRLLDSKNRQNRTQRSALVERYKREMAEGSWRTTHQGIAFDINGVLTDGQHRLQAIAASSVAVTLMVTEGEAPADRDRIDQHGARSLADNFEIKGVAKASVAASAIGVIAASMEGISHRLTTKEAARLRERHRDGLVWASENVTSHAGSGRAPIIGAFVYAHPAVGSEKLTKFYEDLRVMDGIRKNDAMYQLDRLLRGRSGESRVVWFYRTLTAIHYRLHNETCLTLRPAEQRIEFFRGSYR